EHLATAASEQERGMWLLHGTWCALESVDRVVLALERELAPGEELLDDGHRLREPLDPRARRIERHAGLLVIRDHPPRADPEVEPAVGEQVERRSLFGQHHRMPVVVVENKRADAQRGRGI